ncbi:MAG: photosynthetic complex putative assembly protein PuhB [Pseudomonadales bacterium]
MSDHDDFEVEPVNGLPEQLPAGESILWQGQPQWWQLACRAFHVRKVAFYFLVLIVWEVVSGIDQGFGALLIGTAVFKLLLAAAFGIGLLMLLAWGCAREAVFTLTNKRLVMRFGIALRLTLNLPYSRIESGSLRPGRDGYGDVALLLDPEDRISYAVLWPHARPWQFRRPQPTLRCIANAAGVADILAAQLSENVAKPVSDAAEADQGLVGAYS